MHAALLALTLIWPVPAPVSTDFAPPSAPWLAGHRGLDLPAQAGTAVRTPRAGTVAFAGSVAGKDVIVISHGWLRATYEPVQAIVAVGQRVRAGEVIGLATSDESHCSATCLHWGLKYGQDYLDPRLLLRTHAILTPRQTRVTAPAAQ